MKSLLLGIMCAVAIALGGCVTADSGSVTVGTPASPISAAQQTAQKICSFVPTAATVAAIFAKNVPGLNTASAVAQAICAAVIDNPMTEGPGGGRTVPKVLGVPIKGTRV